MGAGGPWQRRPRGDAAPPGQELGRRRRPDRKGDSGPVPARTAERSADGTSDARGPAWPIVDRAGRAGSGVPDVPPSAAAEGGEGGGGDPEGTRAHAGPGGDERPPASTARPVARGRVL